jgi:hypothetical protein
MSWIVIDIETLKEAKVAALIEALDTEALGSGQPNRAAGLIQGVVNEVRLAVASCAANQVDEDPTKIPDGLRDLTVDLINARLKNTLEYALTQDERDTVAERRRQLRDVAACDLVVDQPDDPVDPPVQGPSGGAWGSDTKINMRSDPT